MLSLKASASMAGQRVRQQAEEQRFCIPIIKCSLTSKLSSCYRDKYVIKLYLDETTTGYLSGRQKTNQPQSAIRQLAKER
jgi:hypothetical protein